MRKYLPIIALAALAGCATPETVLKSGSGEVKTCGGGYAGSIVAGLPGYYIEQQTDRQCVDELKAQGYRVQ